MIDTGYLYSGQLVIFVSTATISKADIIEKGTDAPNNRFHTFEISRKLNIPTVLYMKPILKGIKKIKLVNANPAVETPAE